MLVLDSYCIKYPVVLYQLKRAILFLDKKDWCCHGGLGRLYLSCAEVFSDKYIQL